MDVNASVDIGKNLTELVNKLAGQIGITGDKLFPWYVKQQIIEGYTYLCLSATSLIVGIILSVIFFKKEGQNKSEYDGFILVVCTFVVFLSFIFVVFGSGNAVSQIINPEYHATKELISNLSKLVNK